MPFIDGIRKLTRTLSDKYTRDQVAFYNEYVGFCKKDNVQILTHFQSL